MGDIRDRIRERYDRLPLGLRAFLHDRFGGKRDAVLDLVEENPGWPKLVVRSIRILLSRNPTDRLSRKVPLELPEKLFSPSILLRTD